jgi:hypothetical protein
MSLVLPGRSVVKSRVLLITWLLAFGLTVYLAENLWVDRWIQGKFKVCRPWCLRLLLLYGL